MTGVIVDLMQLRGFGFVLPYGCTDRWRDAHFFAHVDCESGTFDALRIGHVVEFEPTYGDRGLRAANVRRADPAA
jgi:cold shock CspA family protein